MSDALTIAGIVIVFAGLSGADAEFLFGRQRSQTIREALKNGNLTARRCLQCGLVCGMITSFMPVVLIKCVDVLQGGWRLWIGIILAMILFNISILAMWWSLLRKKVG